MRFEDLPIKFSETEHKDGWTRWVDRDSTIEELLDIFPLSGNEQIVQVLRLLKRQFEINSVMRDILWWYEQEFDRGQMGESVPEDLMDLEVKLAQLESEI